MYRRVYRQEGGGLSDLGSEAFMRQYVDNYVQDYNRRNQGEVAAKVRTPVRKPSIPQRIKKGISSLVPLIQNNPMAKLAQQAINAPEIAQLESEYGPGYTGKPSDARHQAASNEISKSVSNLIDKGSFGLVPEKVRDFVGDIVPNLGGGIKELGSLVYNIAPNRFGVPSPMPPKEALDMAIEDIAANYEGSFGTDNTKTAREIYEDVYREQPTVNPLDYQNEFNFRRNYLSDYIDSSQDKFGDEGKLYSYGYIPEVSPMYNATQETGRSFDPQIFSEYQKASDAADRAWGYRNNPEQASAFQPVATPISMQNEQQATGFQKVNDINNAFQKVNNEVLKPVQEQQQGLPRLMEIVNEQLNPTPVDPNAPYGYVEYTPPFYGGMMIPPGGNKPYMVPADKDGNPVNPKGIFKATL